MDVATLDPVAASKGTSCKMTEDLSNYWTASIYFQSPENGTFKRVPQMANKLLNGEEGGLTVYYTSPGGNQVTAFKPVSRLTWMKYIPSVSNVQ